MTVLEAYLEGKREILDAIDMALDNAPKPWERDCERETASDGIEYIRVFVENMRRVHHIERGAKLEGKA